MNTDQRADDPAWDAGALADRLWQSAYLAQEHQLAERAARLASEAPEVMLRRAARLVLVIGLESLWATGWQPVDVWQRVRRGVNDDATALVVSAITEQSARYAEAALHPHWRRQLAELGAQPAADTAAPELSHMLTLVLRTLAEMRRLPKVPKLIPPPGEYTGADHGATATTEPGPGRSQVDPKILARVRALLAKAESTDYPEEADAFFAKAQELMSRYSLQRAVIEATDEPIGAWSHTGGRRIWLDNPYLSPKYMLVHAVATANRCECVFQQALGFATVVGADTDTEIVELLATSLLVQASRAMVREGSRTGWNGTSRTKAFRHSFLVSYAHRIGERLGAAARQAETQARSELGDARLLPVLAARDDAVQRRVVEYFPRVVAKRVSASDPSGWVAGRAAADLANLDVHRALR